MLDRHLHHCRHKACLCTLEPVQRTQEGFLAAGSLRHTCWSPAHGAASPRLLKPMRLLAASLSPMSGGQTSQVSEGHLSQAVQTCHLCPCWPLRMDGMLLLLMS